MLHAKKKYKNYFINGNKFRFNFKDRKVAVRNKIFVIQTQNVDFHSFQCEILQFDFYKIRKHYNL